MGGKMTRNSRQRFVGSSALGSSLKATKPYAVELLKIWMRMQGRRLFVRHFDAKVRISEQSSKYLFENYLMRVP